MNNISFLTLNIYSLIVLVILCAVFFSKKRLHKKEDETYGLLLVNSLITIIFGLLLGISVTLSNPIVILQKIINKIYLIGLIFNLCTFALYTNIISYPDSKKKRTKIYKLILLVNALIVLISPLKIEYMNNSPIATGLATYYTYGIFGIVFLYLLFLVIKNIKKLNKKYIPILLIIADIMIITGIQMVYPEANYIINPSTVLTLLIMYFTIENPDVKMLEEVSIAKDSAEKANSAKTDFLSNMSHEIRTPLNAIVGFSESLKEDPIPEASKDKVNDILIASNNLLEIVNGILDISKIEANKLEIINKEYDVHSMFDELISLTKARIGDRDLDFKVKIDPSLPSVLYGDNTRIKQVILNILTNAVKYTKEGFVEFTVSTIIKDNICRLIISVEDSGIGIKEESIPKLFSKFERLNVEKQITIEGTGLGLAISKKLLELMNGKIIVQSVYGKGSKFTISIDQRIIAIEKPATKQPAKTESKHIDANGAKVLLVDDNELNIKVAATLLKKYNFTIDSCTSAYACFAKLNNGEKFDVILMDDMMPKMTGKEAVKKLKSNPNFKTPVIVLTANAITGMREEYLAAGFDDYLSKPIEKIELERVIKEHINVTNSVQMNSSLSRSTNSIFENKIEIENPISTEPTFSYSKNKILLVDDNELNLKVALTTLKKYNLDITTVTSGSECIEKVITEKYDLILLDDMMPELDGCATLENLKSIEDFNTPTIMMTASSKDEVQEKLEKYGFDGYLSKPFNRNDLEEILDSFLN